MPSNLSALTRSHKIIALKKHEKRKQVKEVVFDEAARNDFLTGFHKRKVQKKEEAKKRAQDREKQDRVEARREKRRTLAERAAKNAEAVEKAYQDAVLGEEAEDETVFSSPVREDKPTTMDEEYDDEEQLATVTIVEDFDPDTLLHGTNKRDRGPDEDAVDPPAPSTPNRKGKPRSSEKVAPVMKKSQARISRRAKDVKYQTKAERNLERTKQRRRKLEKAELAGGKSRKKGSSRGRR